MKRFTETTKWTNNKWFRKLSLANKLFWIYICDMCDPVGVWEEDIEQAGWLIGYTYSIDSLLKVFNNKIKVFRNEKKWWIKDFCNFQYSKLQNDPKNKPHTSYINLLKGHDLYEDYLKGIDTLKEKEKEKDKVKDKDKEKDKEKNKVIEKLESINIHKYVIKEIEKLIKKYGVKKLIEIIDRFEIYQKEFIVREWDTQYRLTKRWNKITENIHIFESIESLNLEFKNIAKRNKRDKGNSRYNTQLSQAEPTETKEQKIKTLKRFISDYKKMGADDPSHGQHFKYNMFVKDLKDLEEQ